MAQGMIYMVDESGALRRMAPSAPKSEDHMQSLVAQYPELITDGDGDLLLIRREQPISDSTDGSGRWSLDHLFVTRDAVPVLVELKRAVDTRLRREVVGQILDYAANATAYWQAGRIADAFAATCTAAAMDPDETLTAFLAGVEAQSFWEQVDSNFKAGRIKLVFVADNIPRELATIVEFLNDQMRADVRAVELRWFSDGGITTLSPRIIGETERIHAVKAASRTVTASYEEWIERHVLKTDTSSLAAINRFKTIIETSGGKVDAASLEGGLYGEISDETGKRYYPFHIWNNKTKSFQISISLKYLAPHPAFSPDHVRQNIYNDALAIFGTLSTENINGFPAASLALLNEPNIADKFHELVRKVIAVANRTAATSRV